MTELTITLLDHEARTVADAADLFGLATDEFAATVTLLAAHRILSSHCGDYLRDCRQREGKKASKEAWTDA